ncbi:MAG: Fe-S cluster assembly protein SufD [Candidatus Delongbacteria bacterium]
MNRARTLTGWLTDPPDDAGLVAGEARARLARRALELGLPTARDEAWRYSRLEGLAEEELLLAGEGPAPTAPQLTALTPEGVRVDRVVVVNGRLMPELCEIGPLPAGVGFGSLRAMARAAQGGLKEAADLLERLDSLCRPDQRMFSALNTALAGDATGLWVPDGVRLERPLLVISLVLPGADALLTQPRLLVITGRESQASVMEAHGGFGPTPYFCNAVSEFHLGAGATLEHLRVQRDSPAGRRVSGAFLRVEAGAHLRSHTFTTGGRSVRNEFQLELAGAGARGEVNGLSLLSGESVVDNHTHVTHLAPDCESRQTFRSILAERSRGVFTGRILVARDAQRTDAVQSFAGLLLSDTARALARPQLEILADDVKCTHGATVGSLDPDSLFYLRSRGIPKALARRLLIHAFCSDLLGRVRTSEMVNPLDRLVTRTLAEQA